MPVYLHCPHCEHPQIVAGPKRGKTRFCKQCGRAYQTSQSVRLVRPVAASSIAELRAQSGSKDVYVIEA